VTHAGISATGIQTSFDGVAHLLRDHSLEVPPFQRSYSWDADEVTAFWQDLRAALVNDQPVYFLGTVLVSPGSLDRMSVVDGQQRLATTSMLLAVARDAFTARGDQSRAETLNTRYVVSTVLRTSSLEPRLLLNVADRDFYLTYVVNGERDQVQGKLPESLGLIKGAFDLLTKLMDEDLQATGPHWQERLLRWVELLDSRARVIVVRVADDADAFLIFETLNDRGLPLSVADVVKNYLFGLCRARVDEAQECWTSAIRSVEASSDETEYTTFLRQWWSSLHGATRKSELYKRIRAEIRSEDAAMESLLQIETAAPRFAAIASASHEFWAASQVETRDAVQTLINLQLEQYRPLLLAAMGSFKPEALQQLLRALTAWSVRGLIVGGIGGGTTERYYAEAAVRISRGKAVDVGDVHNELVQVIPSDYDFKEAFARRRVNKSRLLHYYLRSLVDGDPVPGADTEDTVAVPLLQRREVLGTAQPGNEAATQALTRIGNFVLVQRDVVRSLPVDPSERRQILVRDDLLRLEGPVEGDLPDAISSRQLAMATRATDVWQLQPIDPRS
jgi:Protein of unknown function DUF262